MIQSNIYNSHTDFSNALKEYLEDNWEIIHISHTLAIAREGHEKWSFLLIVKKIGAKTGK